MLVLRSCIDHSSAGLNEMVILHYWDCVENLSLALIGQSCQALFNAFVEKSTTDILS